MRLQFSLTVPAAKRFIALGAVALPEVRAAREHGRILLKGGTTVSCLSEMLAGRAMMISGRISPNGTRTAGFLSSAEAPHALLLERGECAPMEPGDWPRIMADLRPGDLLVTGANMIDDHGGAALMCGSAFGDGAGPWLGAAPVEGFGVLVLAGLEKLVPGSVQDHVRRTGRRLVDRAYGMAVGLLPLHGRVFTELDAARALAGVECWVVGRGGLAGAEGGTTLVAEGPPVGIETLESAFLEARDAVHSGTPESLDKECGPGSPGCRRHIACQYARGRAGE